MSWEQWLKEVLQELGARHEELCRALGDDVANRPDHFVHYNRWAGWVGRAALGRNPPGRRGYRHARGTAAVFVEPVAYEVTEPHADGDEWSASGPESYLDYSVHLPLTDLMRRRFGDAGRTGAVVGFLCEHFSAPGEAPAAEVAVWPHEQRSPAHRVLVVEDRPGCADEGDGVWISIRGSRHFNFNDAENRPAPREMAHDLVKGWDRFAELIQFLRGYLTPATQRECSREALIGFAGEYVASRHLPDATWVGGFEDHDFISNDKRVMYEVKSSVINPPSVPYFSTNELRLAVSRKEGAYDVIRVGLDASAFHAFESAIGGLERRGEFEPIQSDVPWIRHLVADCGCNEAAVVNAEAMVLGALERLAKASNLVSSGNPFAREPLSALGAVAGRLGEGSISIRIA